MPLLWLLFVSMPIIELFLLIKMGSLFGFWATVGFVLVTGTIGWMLFRWEMMRLQRRMLETVQSGGLPYRELLDGLLLIAGALLMITPGVITDLVGILLVLPGSRHLVRAVLMRWGKDSLQSRVMHGGPGGSVFFWSNVGGGNPGEPPFHPSRDSKPLIPPDRGTITDAEFEVKE